MASVVLLKLPVGKYFNILIHGAESFLRS